MKIQKKILIMSQKYKKRFFESIEKMSKKYKISLEQNLEKYILRDPFEDLIKIVNDRNIKNSLEKFVENTLIGYTNSNVNKESKAHVIYVSPNELPSGDGWKVLGQYDPNTHTIYVANNLSPDVERFVYYHEEAHSLGIMDERTADDYAASKVGYHLRRSYGMAA